MGELEARVSRGFSSLYLTLVSVLVGLVLSDLFSAVHDRMVLWPLTLETARTWCQIFGNSLAVLSAWVTYSHLGLLRSRVPTIWDTVDAMLVLVAVPLNAATGRHDAAAWFFWAAGYCALGMTAVRINVRQAAHEPALAHVPRIARFGGPYTYLYLGAPGYLAMAAASWLHKTTPLIEVAAAATAPIAGVGVTIVFMREWRAAVLDPPRASAAPDIAA
jgi:hypothetical protein